MNVWWCLVGFFILIWMLWKIYTHMVYSSLIFHDQNERQILLLQGIQNQQGDVIHYLKEICKKQWIDGERTNSLQVKLNTTLNTTLENQASLNDGIIQVHSMLRSLGETESYNNIRLQNIDDNTQRILGRVRQ